MTSFVLGIAILFAPNFVPSPCEGKVNPPPDGNRFTFLHGSTEKIKWSYDNDIDDVRYRAWTFTSSDGSPMKLLAQIFVNDDPEIFKKNLQGVEIEKPATLVLRNISQRYNGTYRFELAPGNDGISEVVVFIAVTPIVTVDCSSPITVNKSDNFTCVCRGKDGNPPAEVTWFKDNVQIGSAGKEEQTLTLLNVDKDDIGTYRCEAKSHEQAKNEKSIELIIIVNYAPEEPYFQEKAVVGKSFTIECKSNGRPSPRYTIIHNDTTVVSTDKTYTIDIVRKSHAGKYKCIAENELGSNSKIYHLAIIDELIIPTTATTNQNFPTTKDSGKVNTIASREVDGTNVVTWHIVVSLVSGIIIGLILAYILLWAHRCFRNRKPEQNPEQRTTEVDTTYQGLDLTKMNTEDNYQPLRVTPASKDGGNNDESTYTDLNKTRDDENNYQSLT